MYKLLLFFCFKTLQSVSTLCIGIPYNDLVIANTAGWRGNIQGVPTLGYNLDISGSVAAPSEVSIPFTSLYIDDVDRTSFYKPSSLAASKGRSFMVTSSSPISPTGISLTSECVCKGLLPTFGTIPFLGAVVLDGIVLNTGIGAVSSRCGSNEITIMSERVSPYGDSTGQFAYKFTTPMIVNRMANDIYTDKEHIGVLESLDFFTVMMLLNMERHTR